MERFKFDRIVFNNRWRRKRILRYCDWTVFGLHKKWFGINSYSYTIALFGFDCSIWFKRN